MCSNLSNDACSVVFGTEENEPAETYSAMSKIKTHTDKMSVVKKWGQSGMRF